MKKPRLSLFEPGAAAAEPPASLGVDGRAFWTRLLAASYFADLSGQEFLAQMASTMDTIALLQDEIDRNGAVLRTRDGYKANPATKDLLAARAFLVRTMLRLGLSYEAVRT